MILEILTFALGGFWRFCGCAILLSIVADCLLCITKVLVLGATGKSFK